MYCKMYYGILWNHMDCMELHGIAWNYMELCVYILYMSIAWPWAPVVCQVNLKLHPCRSGSVFG